MKEKKNESNIRDLWDTIYHDNLCIIGIQEKKEKRRLKMYLKKLSKNSQTKLGNIEVQEAQRALNKMNPKRTSLRHIIMKIKKRGNSHKVIS